MSVAAFFSAIHFEKSDFLAGAVQAPAADRPEDPSSSAVPVTSAARGDRLPDSLRSLWVTPTRRPSSSGLRESSPHIHKEFLRIQHDSSSPISTGSPHNLQQMCPDSSRDVGSPRKQQQRHQGRQQYHGNGI
ncbi:UNVERIFIED_CONTAM: hypothetical protein PYX00_006591 [Menopon gallinae]|uniref:Uncharacterized protein n=1 Tax=Menopon gallinae TaxID=328185 RepID=A0AAW2HX06_9NEOP